MARVLSYCRRSEPGEEDANLSIGLQDEVNRKWATENGHEVVRVEKDPGGKSTTLNRPVLLRVMEAARRGEFDILVVWRYDRFSRRVAQQSVAIYQLQKYGVQVVSATQPVPDGPLGDMLRMLYAFAAEMELSGIVSRFQGGRRRRSEALGLLPGRPYPNYGYRLRDVHREGDNGGLEADWDSIDGNPEHAPAHVVQRIFRLASEGTPLWRIGTTLEAEGVPTPSQVNVARGRVVTKLSATWSRGTLFRILTNPLYMGHVVVYRHVIEEVEERNEIGEIETRKHRKKLPLDHEDVITLPSEHVEALVDALAFYGVQDQMAERKRNAPRNLNDPEASILRGMVTCGYCGRKMSLVWHEPTKGYRYRCQSNALSPNDPRPCEGRGYTWAAEKLDGIVWRWYLRVMERPEIVRQSYEEWQVLQEDGSTLEQDRLDSIAHLMADGERRRKNFMVLAGAAPDDQTRDEYAALAEQERMQLAGLTREKAELERTLRAREEREALLDSFTRHSEGLRDQLEEADFATRREMLQSFAIEVTLWRMTDECPLAIRWAFIGDERYYMTQDERGLLLPGKPADHEEGRAIAAYFTGKTDLPESPLVSRTSRYGASTRRAGCRSCRN